ncbi:MAG: type II 3-dehydroquinate dehydratase [Solirubrobacterales bacterium]
MRRVAVIHGVNLNMLGKRPAEHYGSFTLDELNQQIGAFAREFSIETMFFQTNHESKYVELLQQAPEFADGLILNPGAWTHYSWAIRDALETTGLPAVEVHLSDVESRDEFRKTSVIREICFATVAGKGADGYREALQALSDRWDA